MFSEQRIDHLTRIRKPNRQLDPATNVHCAARAAITATCCGFGGDQPVNPMSALDLADGMLHSAAKLDGKAILSAALAVIGDR